LALKKYSNLNSKKLYDATISELKEEWESSKNEGNFNLIFEENNRYPTHYFLPQTNSSKAIFTLVQSPAFIPEIRKRTADKEETITKIGYQLTPYFHVNDQFMVWDELRKDARFGKQTYNII